MHLHYDSVVFPPVLNDHTKFIVSSIHSFIVLRSCGPGSLFRSHKLKHLLVIIVYFGETLNPHV